MASATPRIVEARSRAAMAKRAIAVVSVTGFLAAFVLARAGHPGHTTSQPSSPSTSSSQRSDEGDEGFGFGSGSIAPSQNVAPSVSAGATGWDSTSTMSRRAGTGARTSKPTRNCSANPAMCKRRRMETTIGCSDGKPYDAKVSRTVWGEG